MSYLPRKISLSEWDDLYSRLKKSGFKESLYGGKLSRHLCNKDFRLQNLRFDNSAAALRLWNFLLTEEERLHESKRRGKKIIGAMKDLGTIPVMAFSLDNTVAFYPDGAWWAPCIMEMSDGLFKIAETLGIDESFCPVRAMLGAFLNKKHFPIPDLLICSVGAICDDFSAIAQRLSSLGFDIKWWEIPHRRHPEFYERRAKLPGGFIAPKIQIDFVKSELERIKIEIEKIASMKITDRLLKAGIKKANKVRMLLAEIREIVFTAVRCPLPALEEQIAEMLAIHFCSDLDETIETLNDLLREIRCRVKNGWGFSDSSSVRVFWVNPVADLRAMNLLEECGGRLCGTDFLFLHALDFIPENLPPVEALAYMALADPMVGSSLDRAQRILKEIKKFKSEAVIISRIPGASHCAMEGDIIRNYIKENSDIPTAEIEVFSISDSLLPQIRNRIEPLIETVKHNRK